MLYQNGQDANKSVQCIFIPFILSGCIHGHDTECLLNFSLKCIWIMDTRTIETKAVTPKCHDKLTFLVVCWVVFFFVRRSPLRYYSVPTVAKRQHMIWLSTTNPHKTEIKAMEWIEFRQLTRQQKLRWTEKCKKKNLWPLWQWHRQKHPSPNRQICGEHMLFLLHMRILFEMHILTLTK